MISAPSKKGMGSHKGTLPPSGDSQLPGSRGRDASICPLVHKEVSSNFRHIPPFDLNPVVLLFGVLVPGVEDHLLEVTVRESQIDNHRLQYAQFLPQLVAYHGFPRFLDRLLFLRHLPILAREDEYEDALLSELTQLHDSEHLVEEDQRRQQQVLDLCVPGRRQAPFHSCLDLEADELELVEEGVQACEQADKACHEEEHQLTASGGSVTESLDGPHELRSQYRRGNVVQQPHHRHRPESRDDFEGEA